MLGIRKGRSDEAANEAALPKDQSVAHGLGSRRCIPSIKQEAVRRNGEDEQDDEDAIDRQNIRP